MDTIERYKQFKSTNSTSPNNKFWGMEENIYIMFMHIAQYAGYIIPGLGFILPIIMWLNNKDNLNIDRNGKNIANFMISMIIYMAISAILCLIFVGFVMLSILGALSLIFVIIAAIKAYNNEYWKYPMTIQFFS